VQTNHLSAEAHRDREGRVHYAYVLDDETMSEGAAREGGLF